MIWSWISIEIFMLEFGQYFDVDVWLRFWNQSLVEVLKLIFYRDLCKKLKLWNDLKKLLWWEHWTLGFSVPFAMFVSDPGQFKRVFVCLFAQIRTDHGVGVLDQLVLGHLLRLARLPQQVPQEALQQPRVSLGKGIVSAQGNVATIFVDHQPTAKYGSMSVWYERKTQNKWKIAKKNQAGPPPKIKNCFEWIFGI